MTFLSGKMTMLVIFVLLMLFLAFVLTPLALAPLGVFTGLTHGFREFADTTWHFRPWFPFFPLWGFSLFFCIVWIAVIIWVYKDAERRGMSGILWALLVFIGNLIGLLIYLIVRQDHPVCCAPETPRPAASPPGSTLTCPSCKKPVEKSFTYCPHCGAAIQLSCKNCGKPVEAAWKVCPHCGTQLKSD
jgi:RNA polymerase subunit RPABC4/transcription elongation factor Spt4